jgi:hypothetical protein
MAIVCNFICKRFENTTKRPGSQGYSNGLKRCKRCHYCLVTKELRCNCCHGLFKTKRTSGVNRVKNKIEESRI